MHYGGIHLWLAKEERRSKVVAEIKAKIEAENKAKTPLPAKAATKAKEDAAKESRGRRKGEGDCRSAGMFWWRGRIALRGLSWQYPRLTSFLAQRIRHERLSMVIEISKRTRIGGATQYLRAAPVGLGGESRLLVGIAWL
jgi:hypothetical protein